jgi:DNA primase
MGLITNASIEEIRSRSSIAALFREITELYPRGSRLACCCPFHAEKSPSCYIDESKGTFHCFGCGIGGDIFSFVMKLKSVDFREAVEALAEKYRVPLNIKSTSSADDGRFAAAKINEIVKEIFIAALRKAPLEVEKYLDERGINQELRETFHIGYAPPEGKFLISEMVRRGISETALEQFGLARRGRDGRLYDLFRGRVIFPISSHGGKVLGFGGRIIPKLFSTDAQHRIPKYINSPETPLYKKQDVLFGILQASLAARSSSEMYVVEGYLDVISLHCAGIKNVVACCGTALGKGHISLLQKFASKIIILFDGDSAGQRAAINSYPLVAGEPVELMAAFLPSGEDPDSFVKTRDAASVRQLPQILMVEAYVKGLVQAAKDNLTLGNGASFGPGAKERVIAEVLKVARSIASPVAQDDLLRRTGAAIGIGVDILYNILKREKPPIINSYRHKEDKSRSNSSPQSDQSLRQFTLLELELVRALLGSTKAGLLSFPLKELEIVLNDYVRTFINDFIENARQDPSSVSSQEYLERRKKFVESAGSPWRDLWDEVMIISEKRGVDFKQLLNDCIKALRRRVINEGLKSLEAKLLSTQNESERLSLMQRKVAMVREAKLV